MTDGAIPGVVIVPSLGPVLPAATQTVSPFLQAASLALLIGSERYPFSAGPPKERFKTFILYFSLFSTTHCTPATTLEMGPPPFSSSTLTPTSRTSGATPRYFPRDSRPLPPIIPATWVP